MCVLTVSLAGDIVSLCTVACVCCAWRRAASEPSLWRRLQALPAHRARCLDCHDIEALATRSQCTLESIDLTGTLVCADEAKGILRFTCGRDISIQVVADADDVVKSRRAAEQVGLYFGSRDDSDVDEYSDADDAYTYRRRLDDRDDDERWRSQFD
jgi:hypothetical protein